MIILNNEYIQLIDDRMHGNPCPSNCLFFIDAMHNGGCTKHDNDSLKDVHCTTGPPAREYYFFLESIKIS